MKRLAILLAVVPLLASCAHRQSATLDLKPGFYAVGEPGCIILLDYGEKANLSISLSWHDGISISSKKKWNITLDDLRSEIRKTKERTLAKILLEPMYWDKDLHEQVVRILQEEGFEEIVIFGAHSRGIILEKHIVNSEQKNQPDRK